MLRDFKNGKLYGFKNHIALPYSQIVKIIQLLNTLSRITKYKEYIKYG